LLLLSITKHETEAERRRFGTTEEIQAESQRVTDTQQKRDFRKRSKNEEGRTEVYMREGTTSKVMAVDRPDGVL
jgi:hypothetical protein